VSSDEHPGGPDAYREGTEAARARVQALERELSSARHQLSAMEARPAPPGAALVAGLRLLFFAMLADLILGLLSWLGNQVSSAHDLRRMISGGFSVLFAGVAVTFILAVVRLRRPAGELGKGGVLGWALAGWIANLALRLFTLTQVVATTPLVSYESIGWTVQMLAWRAAALLCYVPLLFLYHRLGRRLGRRDLTGLNLAAGVVFLLVQAVFTVGMLPGFLRGSSVIFSVMSWVGVGSDVLWTVLAGMALAAARRSPAELPITAAADRSWAGPAAGLRLHRVGVLVKIGAAVLGALLVGLATAAREPQLARMLLVPLLLLALGGSGVGLAGLIRFARVPEETGARTLATLAAVLGGAGLCADLWVMVLTVQLLGGALGAFSLAKQVQALEPLGLALSLPAVILLLVGLRRVASFLGDPAHASRATQLIVLMAVVAPVAVLMKLPPVARAMGPVLILPALLLLGVAIYALVRYLALIGGLSRAMEERARGG